MIVQAEVDENGIVKISDPELRGKRILLSLPDKEDAKPEGKTNWSKIWKIFKEADMLDIPRRSSEEIIRSLHEFRESAS